MTTWGSEPTHDSRYIERLLFPRIRVLDLTAIIVLSSIFSLLLTGTQIVRANWGMIDDHEIFYFLGPDLRLPANEIWSTLLTKTEVGQLQGRFRPSFYVITLVQAWLFGPDVHLWYLRNSFCFALFLSALWWTMSRHVNAWLGGAITAWIALLPLWAGIWSRLGPSEIYGAAFVGIMLFAAEAILVSDRPTVRRLAAVVLTLAALVLAGLKETFLPLAAGGTGFVLVLAGIQQRLSLRLIVAMGIVISIGVSAIGLVVAKEVGASGADYYGRAVGFETTIRHATTGVFDALLRTWWVWALPIALLQLLEVLPKRSWRDWISESRITFAGYALLVLMYGAQCGLYRMSFPQHTRYDFPAMLLVPLTCCIFICEVSCRLRDRFPDRTIDYAQLTVAIFLIFGLVSAHLEGIPSDLAQAVRRNINTTNAFFAELQRVVRSAKDSPDRPVILDAHGPGAYEGIYSLRSYLRAFGIHNAIALRYHPEKNLNLFYDTLQRNLSALSTAGDGVLIPIEAALKSRECVSVGLYGPPDSTCITFEIDGN